jgi:NADPH:quinone reductase-like Zn-dependent oxidoreductase
MFSTVIRSACRRCKLRFVLSDRGVLVTYASATGQPLAIDELQLIRKHLTVKGFSLGDYDHVSKVLPAQIEAAPLVASGRNVSMLGDRRTLGLAESIEEAERLFIEDFDTSVMTGYYLYSKYWRAGVSAHIGTEGAR